MSEELNFDPFPFISGSHQQTILGSLLQIYPPPRSKTKYVKLPDGDLLAIEITTPRKWKKTDMTVVMLHGLCGSHKSPYLIRMTKKLKKKKIRSIRVNLRGCGSGKGLAKKIYHCGQSDDILYVLKAIKEETPESDIVLMGFSLGGNIVLKLSGELKNGAHDYFKKVIAIGPPVDLLSSVNMFREPKNQVYEQYFIRLLKEDLFHRFEKFPDVPYINFPEILHFFEFDQLVTAPYYGYSNPYEYYDECSSKKVITDIAVSCHILLSEDDPIVSSKSLDDLVLPENIRLYKTKKGGHLGYLGHFKTFYWLDHVLLQWITDTLNQ